MVVLVLAHMPDLMVVSDQLALTQMDSVRNMGQHLDHMVHTRVLTVTDMEVVVMEGMEESEDSVDMAVDTEVDSNIKIKLHSI